MELLSIICAMGMPTLDQSLEDLIQAMDKDPHQLVMMTGIAKSIGCCIALGVGANECYQMMLGKRAIDVLKLIHIVIISLCISFSGTIVEAAKYPGKALEEQGKAMMIAKNEEVKLKEAQVAALQEEYLKHINKVIAEAKIKTDADREQNKSQVPVVGGVIDSVSNGIDDMIESTKNGLMKAAIWTETKICELLSLIFRFLGEIVFQMSYYGMLVAQRIFMALLAMVCPLMFAISLSPHYKSAWSQWLSKFLSISLWGFVTYICIFYVNFILVYTLDQDIAGYGNLMAKTTKVSWEEVGTLGMQGLGTTCMYVMALMTGAYIIRMVPEAASWLIPGGVSSGAGEKSGSIGTSAVTGAASGVIGGTMGAIGSTATYGMKVAGTMNNGGPSGYGAGIISSLAQNTKLGESYDQGRHRGQSGGASEPKYKK